MRLFLFTGRVFETWDSQVGNSFFIGKLNLSCSWLLTTYCTHLLFSTAESAVGTRLFSVMIFCRFLLISRKHLQLFTSHRDLPCQGWSNRRVRQLFLHFQDFLVRAHRTRKYFLKNRIPQTVEKVAWHENAYPPGIEDHGPSDCDYATHGKKAVNYY